MENNSKIITDNVQQPEDEVELAPPLKNSEEVSDDYDIEAILRLSSHKEPENDD